MATRRRCAWVAYSRKPQRQFRRWLDPRVAAALHYRGSGEQWKLYARLGTPGDENGVNVVAWRDYYGCVEERRVVSLTGISVMETGLADV